MITLVYLEDWVIVYKDGRKVYENHSISAREALRLAEVGFEARILDGTEFDTEVSETGVTPDSLEDVPTR